MVSSKTAEEAISSETPPILESITVESDNTPDPNDVFWDSDDDKANPKNWSVARRWSHVVIISLLTFITYSFPCPVIQGLPLMSDALALGPSAHQCWRPQYQT